MIPHYENIFKNHKQGFVKWLASITMTLKITTNVSL
jgi:hypothetical protein